jgi:glycosyltransferase involved in cell wall biosynthesis
MAWNNLVELPPTGRRYSHMLAWHIITSEYPPQSGGVSDYTHLVAAELAAHGDEVNVWCPATSGETPQVARITINRALGRIAPADLRRVGRQLSQFAAPRRLLVQWVPHGYGRRAMNLAFCLWLMGRARLRGDRVELMVHEPFLAFSRRSWRQSGVAAVHRLMTVILLQAAARVWISIPAWEAMLRPYALGRGVPFAWLPVPSNIAAAEDLAGVSAVRGRYAPPGGRLIGHFGTHGRLITETLAAVAPVLLREDERLALLLIGRGSEALREKLLARHPHLAARLHALGGLAAAEVARHISACDVMLQPYPDGISTRRTSAMAGLVNGRPVVTTAGRLTEPLWAESGAVALVPEGDAAAMAKAVRRLLGDARERARLGAAARALYQGRFDVRQTVAALRSRTAGGAGDSPVQQFSLSE